MAKGSFWPGAGIGFVIMVLLGSALPVLGPLIGGFVAGKFGALVAIILGLLIGTLASGLFGFLAALGIGVVLVLLSLYYAVLGCPCGAAGGLIGR